MNRLKRCRAHRYQLVSIDIFNQSIHLMRTNSAVWTATAAVDPRMIGTVNMRLLAKKLHGEETPSEYGFAPLLIEPSQHPEGTNMEVLPNLISDGALPRILTKHGCGSVEKKMASAQLLEAKQISMAFGGASALSSVDFTVQQGEITTLIGAHGAGESTFMKVLASANPVYSGQVYLVGKAMALSTPRIELGIRMVN